MKPYSQVLAIPVGVPTGETHVGPVPREDLADLFGQMDTAFGLLVDKRLCRWEKRLLLGRLGGALASHLDGTRRPVPFSPHLAGVLSQSAIERAAMLEWEGGQAPSKADCDLLLVTCQDWYVASTWVALTEAARIGMGSVDAEILPGGDVRATYTPGAFDLLAYLEGNATPDPDVVVEDGRDAQLATRLSDFYRSKSPFPEELQDFSDALALDAGFTLQDRFGVMVSLLQMANDSTAGGADVVAFDRQELTAGGLAAVGRLDGSVDPEQALAALVFPPAGTQAEDLSPHRLRRRDGNLRAQPLVEVDGKLLVFRRHVLDVLVRETGSLVDGGWSWNPKTAREKFPNVHKALEARRRGRGPAFETLVLEVLDGARMPSSPLKKNAVVGGVTLRNEADALVVHAATSTLWVVEAKDEYCDTTIHAISTQLGKYLEPDTGHVAKQKQRLDDIQRDPAAVVAEVLRRWVRRRDLPQADADALLRDARGAGAVSWRVRGAFVTRWPDPIGFQSGLEFPVVTLGELCALVAGG